MDIHFTTDVADEVERAAVDSVLGVPAVASGGSERTERSGRCSEGIRVTGSRRDMLLPALHAVHAAAGWISPGALNYISYRLSIPPAEAYGVASFYAMFSLKQPFNTVLHVCDDIACMTRGAEALCDRLTADFGPEGVPDKAIGNTWKRSPCLGLCEKGPAVLCQNSGRPDYSLGHVEADGLLSVLHGADASARLPGGSAPIPATDKTPLLTRVGSNPCDLDAYRASGGYAALRRALELGPSGVIREVQDAGLTGRGGAAFPTAVKWKAVVEAPARPHYLICNADESEPGTFKDRVLMEEDPFGVVEAMTIAGFACGAEQGYCYIRGEYPEATARLRQAIDQARTRGLLGKDIMGRGVEFDIEIRRGAGAYICGEETALLNSIEGRRGEPRNKPPFPAQVGLFGKPTAINNVETLVNLLPILNRGGLRYASIGTAKSTGTRLFCVSGCVQRPGVYEVEFGAKLRYLIEMAGGVGDGRSLQCVLLGGAAGVFVRPDELDIELTLEGVRSAGATLGSGVIMVFDDTVDLRYIVRRIAAFFRDESCGQCVPCRVGAVRQEEALHRLCSSGVSVVKELALLKDLELVTKDASICGLGHTASTAISSAVNRLGLWNGASS
jgi:NADH-quinone oxidoreductase subunit F